MAIGFTGTRRGLTDVQAGSLSAWLDPGVEVHHGCCVGADRAFAEMANAAGCRVEGHPSDLRSMTDGVAVLMCHKVHPPLPPLERNRKIVDSCAVLLACPAGMVEEQRSGTWMTVRYARRAGKRVVLIFPDGRVVEE